MRFENPADLQEAQALLAAGRWTILAGGTDFYPSLSGAVGDVLDISNLKSIKGIEQDQDGHWHIGALTTWTDIIEKDLPAAFDGLKLAAKEVGSIQIQNRATIGGNICNASPAADGIPPLLTLDASVKISARTGQREMPLGKFIQGNRKTDLRSDELVTGLKIPANASKGAASFLKLGARKYLVISISMVAARVSVAEGLITDAAVAVGSCSEVATRLFDLEAKLVGSKADADIRGLIADENFSRLAPIDDIRATKQYRMQATIELVLRAINQTLEIARC